MVKHYILWRYTDKAIAYGKEKLVSDLNVRFKSLIGKIDGLNHIEIISSDLKGDPGYHDLMLYAEFSSREALENYMKDEDHARIRDWDKQYVYDRAGFDLEVE